MSKTDKRPAFPSAFHNDHDRNVISPDGEPVAPNSIRMMPGMTLRQAYAAHAMQGYLASIGEHTEPGEVASTIAADCWKLADALIATENE